MAEEQAQEQEQAQDAQPVTFNLDSTVSLIHRCIATSSATDETKGRASTGLEIMAQWMLNAQKVLEEAKEAITEATE